MFSLLHHYPWTVVSEPTRLLNPSMTFFNTLHTAFFQMQGQGIHLFWYHRCKMRSAAYFRYNLFLPLKKKKKSFILSHIISDFHISIKNRVKLRRRSPNACDYWNRKNAWLDGTFTPWPSEKLPATSAQGMGLQSFLAALWHENLLLFVYTQHSFKNPGF